jgi:hypothetical protein
MKSNIRHEVVGWKGSTPEAAPREQAAPSKVLHEHCGKAPSNLKLPIIPFYVHCWDNEYFRIADQLGVK